ncbi:Tuberin [Fragariocoptes setiger]|uniref:Tuberin n=1 Tax=Fragariocoptes setiger TaxID=1670756 RepID=A0ABQ7S7E0_9ACAR|nr:Tuberin [Fragariocoptes setiger]
MAATYSTAPHQALEKSFDARGHQWLNNLASLMDCEFKHETSKETRLKSIRAFSQVFKTQYAIYEDELMEKVVIPFFSNAENESDLDVRKTIVNLLLDVASLCFNHKHCLEALQILKKILIKPFRCTQQTSDQSNDLVYIVGNADVIDSRFAVCGITKLFKSKLHSLPIEPAVYIFETMVDYLDLTYRHPLQAPHPAEISVIRSELFSTLMSLRANEHYQLGIDDTNNEAPLSHSPFVLCRKVGTTPYNSNNHHHSKKLGSPTSSNSSIGPAHPNNHAISMSGSHGGMVNVLEPSVVNLTQMLNTLIECINNETDWDVLKGVLDTLPMLFLNRILILSASPDVPMRLCQALCNLSKCQDIQQRFNKKVLSQGDVIAPLAKSLASMVYYRNEMDSKIHKLLLSSFENILKFSRQPRVSLFTTCLIEMQDSLDMMRFLPQILMKLSKFSATVHLAMSQLEFLSYLILFPKLYENFAGDEYICIFAIALPYTNPFKFNEYVISMAHRVIAMWFLRCRPSFRTEFVDYIKKHLNSNVIQPFKENQVMNPYTPAPPQQTPPILNTTPVTSPFDQRKRSCSLNDHNNVRRFEFRQSSITLLQHSNQVPTSQPPNSPSSPSSFSFNSDPMALAQHQTSQALSKQLNEELIETCTDLISRYTHGQCSAVAQRNPAADLLVDRSSSQTWLIGNSLITISTSRCTAPNNEDSCNCWSQGWAEILIRRPTGNTCWLTRLQNNLGSMLPISNLSNSVTSQNNVSALFNSMTLNEADENRLTTESESSATGSSLHHDIQPSLSGVSSASTGGCSAGGLGGLHPSFVLLQFFYDSSTTTSGSDGSESQHSSSTAFSPVDQTINNGVNGFTKVDPILLPKDGKSDLALKNFDRITPYETHKIGVVYVDKGQANNRVEILANRYGSRHYIEFLKNLGTLIKLSDVDNQIHFIGGLDVNGNDGEHTYFWQDNITQVVFHVATSMPNRENDPHCNDKNRHIGNDHVCIVYNDSGQEFELSTIKGDGQCILACIVVTPLESDTNMVMVKTLPDLAVLFIIEPKYVSNEALSIYTRQLAIHLNLACMIYERRQRPGEETGFLAKSPYVSNWVERLRAIKRIRKRSSTNHNHGS